MNKFITYLLSLWLRIIAYIMAKISFTTLATQYQSTTALNDNFSAIAAEFQDKVLYRDNTSGETNTMQQNLDMNNKRIINLPVPSTGNEAARYQDILDAADSDLTTKTAALTTIVDADSIFESTNVETALIEASTAGCYATAVTGSNGIYNLTVPAAFDSDTISAGQVVGFTPNHTNNPGDLVTRITINSGSQVPLVRAADGTNIPNSSITINSNVTMVFDGSNFRFISGEVTYLGNETLFNKTLESPVIATGVSGSAIDDDDTLAADSSTLLPTQAAVKGYVDTEISTANSDRPQLQTEQDDAGGSTTIDLAVTPNLRGYKIYVSSLSTNGTSGLVLQHKTSAGWRISFVNYDNETVEFDGGVVTQTTGGGGFITLTADLNVNSNVWGTIEIVQTQGTAGDYEYVVTAHLYDKYTAQAYTVVGLIDDVNPIEDLRFNTIGGANTFDGSTHYVVEEYT